jgi:glycosyltransferase involved in cell wall biosynthesis
VNVVQVSFYVDPQRRAPEQLLAEWFSLRDVAVAATIAGLRVHVIQASMVEGKIQRDGVNFHFLAPGGGMLTRSARFTALLEEISPDIIHVHGLGFPREVIGLRECAPSTPIFLQDHADHPPRFWRRSLWRQGAACAAGVSFCARGQADRFLRAGLLAPHTQIFELPESTTAFAPGDRAAARAGTGLQGEPAVLWVGHFDANKDPLTVLEGISIAARSLPGIQLWCCYRQSPLMAEVSARIERDPALRGRVQLLGHVSRERVQELMTAADMFVHGSHREGGSFALVEALACGLIPVVTDIPALRALTGDGSVGALWPPGDAPALARALCDIAQRPRAGQHSRVLAHFEVNLSSKAMGHRLLAAYQACVSPEVAPAASGAL